MLYGITNVTIIYECSIPRKTDAAERAGFVYLLNRIQKLEKNQDEENSTKNFVLPLSQKYSLNVEEAAAYFGIGERRLNMATVAKLLKALEIRV